MKVSYSKVSTWNKCPYLYKLKYIDKLKTKPDTNPSCALYLGSALHEGIEKRSIEAAIDLYKKNYTDYTTDHEIEILKLQAILPKAINEIPEGEYEHCLNVPDEFIGYIDCLVPVGDNEYDLLDFKYSNDNRYSNSEQVHIYKYYYERLTGNKIRNLYYVLIPKLKDTLNENLNRDDFNKLLEKYKDTAEIKFIKVDYDREKVNHFFARRAMMFKDNEFKKRINNLCGWCEYQKYCMSNGKDKSELLEQEEIREVSLWK